MATITTKIRSIPSEVGIGETEGLTVPSVVDRDELSVLSRARPGERIGPLSADKVKELDEALRFALALRR